MKIRPFFSFINKILEALSSFEDSVIYVNFISNFLFRSNFVFTKRLYHYHKNIANAVGALLWGYVSTPSDVQRPKRYRFIKLCLFLA